MNLSSILCIALVGVPVQLDSLAGYASVPHLIVKAESINWQGQRAVSRTQLSLHFDRSRGWRVQRDEAARSRYDWKDSRGCHRAEVGRLNGLNGPLEEQGESDCLSGGARNMGLGIDPMVSVLNLLEGTADDLIAADHCQSSATGLSCRSRDGSAALVDVEGGRIQRMVLQRASWVTLETVEFSYIDKQPGSRDLRVDTEIAGALPPVENLEQLFQAASGKSRSAMGFAMAYLRVGMSPDGFSEAQLHRLLENAYAAKVPGAAGASAKLYAKANRGFLSSAQRSRGEAALTQEFFKRMAEAAASCEGGVVNSMEAECMEVDCEGNRAIESLAMQAHRQETVTCEARINNPFPQLRRPAWANRPLPDAKQALGQ